MTAAKTELCPAGKELCGEGPPAPSLVYMWAPLVSGGSSGHGKAAQGSRNSPELLKFNTWLNNPLRCRVWFLYGVVWNQGLDSVILRGPFQLGKLNDFQGSLQISSLLCTARGDPPHKHSCNPRQVPKTSLLAKCTLKLQRKRCSQFYYSQRELNMLLEQLA